MKDKTVMVFSDFANQEEYAAIKGRTSFPTVEEHRAATEAAMRECAAKGYKVVKVICDVAGYHEFLRRNKALNTPQNVAMYVNLKHGNLLDQDHPEAGEQNVEVIR